MNDLAPRSESNPAKITLKSIERVYPNFLEGYRRAQSIMSKIHSWEDVELYLLKGQGLAASSYRTYMVAVRQLYEYTGGLNPFQISANHVEAFYDHVLETVDRNTAYNKIMGLKRFFVGIGKLAPSYVSPFEIMDDKLVKKLSKTKKTRTKKALTVREIQNLLAWLQTDRSKDGKLRYALVLMLVTSGLRAAELCGLRWQDLSNVEGTWTAHFIGKGEKEAEQELYPAAVEACERIRRGEYLFYSKQWTEGKGWTWEPLKPHGLWNKIQKIGKRARAAGVIKRDLQFSPHLFRRSYATALYQSGMKLKAIMEKTRHSNIEVLAKHYIDDQEPAAPYFDKVLGVHDEAVN